MTDILKPLMQDWAEEAARDQPTPLTPALLRAKHLLAREDARRARIRRLEALLVAGPALFSLVVAVRMLHPAALLNQVAALSATTLASLTALLVLGALVGATWVRE